MRIVQVTLILLLVIPVIWGLLNLLSRKKRRHNTAIQGVKVPILLYNGALSYVIGFNVIFFLQELFLVLGKKMLGLSATLYHNNHTWEGDHEMVNLMQGSGAAGIFICGIIFMVVFLQIKSSNAIVRLIFFWLSFHGIFQSLPQIAIGFLDPSTDVGNALVYYLDLNQNLLIGLSIFTLVSMAFLGIIYGRLLLTLAPIRKELLTDGVRFRVILYMAVISGFIGCVLTIPFRILPMSQALTPFLVFAFSIPWLWASAGLHREINTHPNPLGQKIYKIPLILCLVMLLFFRMVLVNGINW
ncbi:hypothetical protein [Portibacter marinus]|uniref:hypothetical protein n=1 Tax=Portibacter marinus TaxID=2898660 RepID=UPI001F3A1546|nr:hypothetical protein [Portibacter marinus]